MSPAARLNLKAAPKETERGPDWRDDAACLMEYGIEPETFFPTSDAEWVEEAKAICRPCPVRDVCLKWALDTGQDYGVWGGLTEKERHQLKKRNRKRGNVTHCKRGHELAGDNLGVYGKNNERRCRACMADTRKKDTA